MLEIPNTLQVSQEEIEALDNGNVMYTEPTMIKHSDIFTLGRKIHNIKKRTNSTA